MTSFQWAVLKILLFMARMLALQYQKQVGDRDTTEVQSYHIMAKEIYLKVPQL